MRYSLCMNNDIQLASVHLLVLNEYIKSRNLRVGTPKPITPVKDGQRATKILLPNIS